MSHITEANCEHHPCQASWRSKKPRPRRARATVAESELASRGVRAAQRRQASASCRKREELGYDCGFKARKSEDIRCELLTGRLTELPLDCRKTTRINISIVSALIPASVRAEPLLAASASPALPVLRSNLQIQMSPKHPEKQQLPLFKCQKSQETKDTLHFVLARCISRCCNHIVHGHHD